MFALTWSWFEGIRKDRFCVVEEFMCTQVIHEYTCRHLEYGPLEGCPLLANVQSMASFLPDMRPATSEPLASLSTLTLNSSSTYNTMLSASTTTVGSNTANNGSLTKPYRTEWSDYRQFSKPENLEMRCLQYNRIQIRRVCYVCEQRRSLRPVVGNKMAEWKRK